MLASYNVMLDSRPVRTSTKEVLSIPLNKQQLATAIALEWDNLVSAQQALKQHYIPLTALTSRALDIKDADHRGDSSIRDDIVKMLLRYLGTDTLLCWAPEKNIHEGAMEEDGIHKQESLRDIQIRTANPIIEHLTARVWPGVQLLPIMEANSILPRPQPTSTIEVVKGWISGLPAFELAGLERAVLASKSLLVAVRLLVEWSQEFQHLRTVEADNRFGIEDAANASNIEVRWQTDMWGEVEDTHDVDREDLKRQLGSVVILVQSQD
jgi:ATP synthase mitochondrial F1 complex assembly factor 2